MNEPKSVNCEPLNMNEKIPVIDEIMGRPKVTMSLIHICKLLAVILSEQTENRTISDTLK